MYDYLIKELKIAPNNIIVFGRSIGSGPACHLAANKQLSCCLLMSPIASLRAVAKEIAGKMSGLLADRFKNIEEVKKIKCPAFFIHGQADKLVPH